MENAVCVCAARLVVSKIVRRRNGDIIELKKAARIVGLARDCIRCSLAKAMLQLKEN